MLVVHTLSHSLSLSLSPSLSLSLGVFVSVCVCVCVSPPLADQLCVPELLLLTAPPLACRHDPVVWGGRRRGDTPLNTRCKGGAAGDGHSTCMRRMSVHASNATKEVQVSM
jgi:hypothetical protein